MSFAARAGQSPEQISETKKKLSLQRWKDAENNYPEYIPTFPEEAVMEIPDEMHREFDSRSVLQRLYGGSLGSFVAALTAEKPLAQSEIDELRRYLDEMSGKAGE